MQGPGIKPGTTFDYLGTNVDVAATWIGLAGLPKPATFDGRSIAPLLINASDPTVPEATRSHLEDVAPGGLQGQATYRASWRDTAFVEYYFNSPNAKCGGYITEDTSNNFIGIRHVSGAFGDLS